MRNTEPMTLGRWWNLAAVTLVVCTVAAAQEGLSVGGNAPDFQLPTIKGSTVSLHEFLNKKLVIVHFWKSK